ncbi:hypothetical protein BDN70DRAFT_108878 [Pholiota conissans]|uniref:Uncharacterized protein n=1 Tax=Pholiota conissans TaxID=109636 RepID=A0A9P6CYN9_9AGAR|nr:hypothetical protein BDN70DRAFT_108878 [Pholiota conissans]
MPLRKLLRTQHRPPTATHTPLLPPSVFHPKNYHNHQSLRHAFGIFKASASFDSPETPFHDLHDSLLINARRAPPSHLLSTVMSGLNLRTSKTPPPRPASFTPSYVMRLLRMATYLHIPSPAQRPQHDHTSTSFLNLIPTPTSESEFFNAMLPL